MVVSAAVKHPKVCSARGGPNRIHHDSLDVDAVVIVEHEDVGDDRRRHQDNMRGGRHLGHGSHLGHGGRRQGRRRSVDSGVGRVCATTAFATKPYVMDMYK